MIEWEIFFNHFNLSRINTQELNPKALHLLICGSFGDVFPNVTLLNEVVKIHKKPVIALIHERWLPLTKRFQYEGVTFVYIKDEQAFKYSLMSEGRQYIFREGWLYPLLPTMHPLICDFVYDGYITDFELKKVILKLPRQTKFTLPKLPEWRFIELHRLFELTGCRAGRTCIFSFENNSNPSLPSEVLINAVRILKKNDIDIALNVASTYDKKSWVPDELSEIPKLKVPSDAPNEFVAIAGGHLGGPNGLTLILANFETDAKVGMVVDCTEDEIINNGRSVRPDSFLLYSKTSPQDVCTKNDFTEFVYKGQDFDDFEIKLDCWAKKFTDSIAFT